MDFFEAIKKVDWYNPFLYVKGRRHLYKNWKRFMEMFELRNEIVHNMKEVKLSKIILSSNCDNTMNFLEATIFIADPQFINDVISQLQSNRPIEKHEINRLSTDQRSDQIRSDQIRSSQSNSQIESNQIRLD